MQAPQSSLCPLCSAPTSSYGHHCGAVRVGAPRGRASLPEGEESASSTVALHEEPADRGEAHQPKRRMTGKTTRAAGELDEE